jgi:carboxypeptidase family protein
VRALILLVVAGCATPRGLAPENRIACSGPHTLADSATGRVQGRVTDAADDAPLAGVEVTVTSRDKARATATDGHGEWRIAELPEGQYEIVVHRGTRALYSSVVHVCAEDVLTLRTPIWVRD